MRTTFPPPFRHQHHHHQSLFLHVNFLTPKHDFSPGKKFTSAAQPLNQTNDFVYSATTNVIKAVMALNRVVKRAVSQYYLNLGKNVVCELRALLASVADLSVIFLTQPLTTAPRVKKLSK